MSNVYKAFSTLGASSAFSSPARIQKELKNVSLSSVKNSLAGIKAYTLHRQSRRPKYKNPFFVYKLKDQFQIDLIDVSKLSEYNQGIKFLLAGIDQFSKKAVVIPLKNKSANENYKGLKVVIQKLGVPKSIISDRGKEFLNKKVLNLIHDNNIKLIHPNGDSKAGTAERFNRTIQDIIFKYLTFSNQKNYVDVLPSLVNTYNSRIHRSLDGLSPIEAENPKNHFIVRRAFNDRVMAILAKKKRNKSLKVNDIVRVKILKNVFGKGYEQQFSEELFKIEKILTHMPVQMYTLKDLSNNEIIEGNFYETELQKVIELDN